MFTRRELFYVGVVIFILFIALFAMEYYAEVPILNSNPSQTIASVIRDKFYNVPYGLEGKRYKNIVDYSIDNFELLEVGSIHNTDLGGIAEFYYYETPLNLLPLLTRQHLVLINLLHMFLDCLL